MSETQIYLETSRGDAALAQLSRDLQRDLIRSNVPARMLEAPAKEGERGDVFSLGAFAIGLVTSGAVTAFLNCVKAYLERDSTLKFTLKFPSGKSAEVTAKNVNAKELRRELEELGATE